MMPVTGGWRERSSFFETKREDEDVGTADSARLEGTSTNLTKQIKSCQTKIAHLIVLNQVFGIRATPLLLQLEHGIRAVSDSTKNLVTHTHTHP